MITVTAKKAEERPLMTDVISTLTIVRDSVKKGGNLDEYNPSTSPVVKEYEEAKIDAENSGSGYNMKPPSEQIVTSGDMGSTRDLYSGEGSRKSSSNYIERPENSKKK